MSEPTLRSLPPGVGDLFDRFRVFDERAAELHPANKASLFAVLRTTSITSVSVRFDGCGDSGQIEEITATTADQRSCDLPELTVELRQLSFGDDEPTSLTQPLREAIEALSYAFLGTVHGGWEINEGAYGDFTFDVAAGTISLNYNERYVSTENYTHEF